MRIAVISTLIPRANFQSGDRRFLALLEILARRHKVHFFGYSCRSAEDRSAREYLRQRGIIVHGTWWKGFVAATATVPFDVALFEFYHSFEAFGQHFRERQPGAVVIVDSVDVHFAREAAAAALGLEDDDRVAALREQELAVYRAADAVIAVTNEDAGVLRAEARLPPIYVIPNVMPLRRRYLRPRAPSALFVGSFRHAPNLDAVRWFVAEIWPLVRSVIGNATFRVAGAQMPASIKSLAAEPGVEILGHVPDIGPFLDETLLSVAPLRFGAGMKGKVNEAMAAGIPVVSTSYGVQGLPVVNGVHALVADDPRSFADAMIRLFNDPTTAERIGTAGQELAQEFSPERVAQLVHAMFDEVIVGQRRTRLYVAWVAAQIKVGSRVVVRRLLRTKSV